MPGLKEGLGEGEGRLPSSLVMDERRDVGVERIGVMMLVVIGRTKLIDFDCPVSFRFGAAAAWTASPATSVACRSAGVGGEGS